MPTRVLGVSAYYHDSAAALIEDGVIVAAAQEERFTRKKHDAGFPRHAIGYCLEAGHVTIDDMACVAFYDKPLLKFERLLDTYFAFAPHGFRSFATAMPVWLREKLFLKDLLVRELKALGATDNIHTQLLFSEHHLSHAASAFYPSPYDEAAILTMDGVGEWATTSLAMGRGRQIEVQQEIHFPHSLGLLYSAFTYYTGFKVNSGEYKLMGLAPYGEPKYASLIREQLIDVKDDGSFRLNLDYFDYCTGLTMTNRRFDALFGGAPRKPEDRLQQRDMDLAASIQAVTEEVVLRLTRSIVRDTGASNVCLAGGVALNCVANGKIVRDGAVKQLWVQPAAGDAGGALGAALVAYHMYREQPRPPLNGAADRMRGSYLGPEFSQRDIEAQLREAGAHFTVVTDDALIDACAGDIASERAVGWFQGRMEFGPRALGGRSILADARSPKMQSVLNLKVKFRESFRPFAPSVLREALPEWFALDQDSPYMLLVADVVADKRRTITAVEEALFGIEKLNVSRSAIPAVTHVDYSARIQTVHIETNPRYHRLLTAFHRLTGCPVIVNTSFNVRGEPLVCTPADAFRCFMGTDIDVLAAGNCYLRKESQNEALKVRYEEQFELD